MMHAMPRCQNVSHDRHGAAIFDSRWPDFAMRLSRTRRHIAKQGWAILRERPRFRILSINVVRFTPRRAAAPDRPPTTQLLSSSAFRM